MDYYIFLNQLCSMANEWKIICLPKSDIFYCLIQPHRHDDLRATRFKDLRGLTDNMAEIIIMLTLRAVLTLISDIDMCNIP